MDCQSGPSSRLGHCPLVPPVVRATGAQAPLPCSCAAAPHHDGVSSWFSVCGGAAIRPAAQPCNQMRTDAASASASDQPLNCAVARQGSGQSRQMRTDADRCGLRRPPRLGVLSGKKIPGTSEKSPSRQLRPNSEHSRTAGPLPVGNPLLI